MDMLQKHPWLATALVIGVVVYVILRRISGEPINVRDLCVFPVVLTAVGVGELWGVVDQLSFLDLSWGVASVIAGLLFGAWRGATVEVFDNDGVLWQRYTGATFKVWLVSLLGTGVLALLGFALNLAPAARPIALAIGIGMLGEMSTMGLRALASGTSFASQRGDSANAMVHHNMKNAMRGAGAHRTARKAPNLRDSLIILARRGH